MHYCVNCPFCDKMLSISQTTNTRIVYKHQKLNPVLISEKMKLTDWVKDPDKKILFDLLNGDYLEILPKQSKSNLIIVSNATQNNHVNYNTIYVRLNFSCDEVECALFDYTLQLKVEVSSNSIETDLNSIRVSYEDENSLNELKFNYISDKVEYTYYLDNGTSRNQELPMMKFKIDNIQETLNKIKKILVFS